MALFLFLLVVFLSTCLLWGALGSGRVVHQVRFLSPLTPSEYGLPWVPLRMETEDRIPISGWMIHHPNPQGILLLLHGFGTSKVDLLDLALDLYTNAPYHLVLVDLRAHGESGGNAISFGKQEVQDIRSILSFLQGDPALASYPIGCFGISMGGAVGILAASELSQIRAVVSDSSYADLARAIARAQWLTYHIPRVPFGQAVIWGTQLRLRCRLTDLSPVRKIGRISPRAVLIIHGMEDGVIPPQEAQALFQAAGEPKQIWLVPGAVHAGSFFLCREEYLNRILSFFKDAFSRTT